jgi:hypothetical protein
MKKKKMILDLEDFKIEKLHSVKVIGGVEDCHDCGGSAAADCSADLKELCKENGTGTVGVPIG